VVVCAGAALDGGDGITMICETGGAAVRDVPIGITIGGGAAAGAGSGAGAVGAIGVGATVAGACGAV